MTGIVFIHKCFVQSIFSQNTSIKNQKSAQNKPFNENLSKPIPNKSTDSYGQKTRYLTLCPQGQEVAKKVFDVNDNLFFNL